MILMDEMVQVAVEAQCEGAWLTMPEWLKERHRKRMRAALEAALALEAEANKKKGPAFRSGK